MVKFNLHSQLWSLNFDEEGCVATGKSFRNNLIFDYRFKLSFKIMLRFVVSSIRCLTHKKQLHYNSNKYKKVDILTPVWSDGDSWTLSLLIWPDADAPNCSLWHCREVETMQKERGGEWRKPQTRRSITVFKECQSLPKVTYCACCAWHFLFVFGLLMLVVGAFGSPQV